MKKLLALTASILISIVSFTQNGFVAGKVVDQTTGEELIGVAIMVKGATKGTSTDIDGTYKLELAPGTYDLQVSYISYQTKVIPGVVVKAKEITSLNITLQSSEKELGEVVIEATVDKETSSALVLEQKNSVVLFDGVSAEQIRKTPDRNTADVLRRVSGATIQDNSFVIVRGLPDRYNAAFINGAPLPSSEPDRKAFAFDIFPAALLNDLKVIKTALPSLPGEFAGGLIQIKTKDIPEKNYYQINIGTSVDAISTFRPFKMGQGGSLDFLGIDDGTRALPAGIPNNEEFRAIQQNASNKPQLVEFAKMFNNNYTIRNMTAMPGLNLQYNMGHVINLIPRSKRENSAHKTELGNVFGITYYNLATLRQFVRKDFNDIEQLFEFRDEQYTMNTSWGGVWNLSLLHSKTTGANNRITLKNMFNVNSNDQFTLRNGEQLALDFQIKSYNYYYTQNMLYATQLNGEHILPKSKIKFEWMGAYSHLYRTIPDYRVLNYTRVDSTYNFAVPFSNTVQQQIASRFFSNQKDNNYTGTFDFTLPFKLGSTRHELKVGSYLQYRNRDFEGRVFGMARYSSFAANVAAISQYDVDSIFDPRNFDASGLLIREVTKKSDSYLFSSSLAAGYIQFNNMFFDYKLKFIWGARLESYRQVLDTYSAANDNDPVKVDTTVIDILPSMNIIYSFHPKMNLRLSGSQTVCRPEARELAPFVFYDFSLFVNTNGNASLQRTKITNADLKYEFYPVGGQSLSFGGFFKWFDNPIEKTLFPGLSEGRIFTYINVPTAYAWGIEVDYRFTIASFLKNNKSRFLENLSFTGNFSYISSEVNLDTVSYVSGRRPMQGQSPYIVNALISYNDSKYNFGISLAVNYFGRRIFAVGDVTYPELWENPRVVLDLQLSKAFLAKKLELKLNIRDLLAQDLIFYQDINGDGILSASGDYELIRQRMSQRISFSVGYKF